ncbi:MAG: hypothetical protein ACLRXQ_09645 [Phascolarctobacterium faecium]
MLVSSGITSMSKATSAEDNAIFGAMSGGSMRYDTGSHADVKAITSLWVWASSCQQCRQADLQALCGIWLAIIPVTWTTACAAMARQILWRWRAGTAG